MLAGNPHADASGNADVWTFFSEPTGARRRTSDSSEFAAGALANDRQRRRESEARAEDSNVAAKRPGRAAEATRPTSRSITSSLRSADRCSPPRCERKPPKADRPNETRRRTIPLSRRGALIRSYLASIQTARRSKRPASACGAAVIEVRLPSDLVQGAELVTTATCIPASGAEAGATPRHDRRSRTTPAGLTPSVKIETQRRRRLDESTIAGFRTRRRSWQRRQRSRAAVSRPRLPTIASWFPAALCYTKIVPVDEVVTLTLFYREDEALSRLMLDDAETARLDRLWDQLHFVSRDALTLVDAFEQLMQFATQDADPTVSSSRCVARSTPAPAAFRKLLVETEPRHVDAVIAWAAKAYRHPLSAARRSQSARAVSHAARRGDRSRRIDPTPAGPRDGLARVLVSVRKAGPVTRRSNDAGDRRLAGRANPISDNELATRLSFFLWSTAPDEELRKPRSSGKLRDPRRAVARLGAC